MKVVWVTLGIVAVAILAGISIFEFNTHPVISPNEAMATAKKQLNFMGYPPPYMNLFMGTGVGWYNKGKLIATERVYFTTLSFQPRPGAPSVNAEVIEDARTGNIISEFQYKSGMGNPVY